MSKNALQNYQNNLLSLTKIASIPPMLWGAGYTLGTIIGNQDLDYTMKGLIALTTAIGIFATASNVKHHLKN